MIEDFCTENSRYLAAEPLTPRGVVLHSIGCPQPSAAVLHRYWARNGSPYLTHYNLDGNEVYHNLPNDRKAWHVGSPGNDRWLGCEMGEPAQLVYTGGAAFTCTDAAAARAYCEGTYAAAVRLIASLCAQYGWDPETAVWTHGEVTRRGLSRTDHADPEHLWRGLGLDYSLAGLRRDVRAAMGGAPSADQGQIYRIRLSWEDAASQVGAYHSLENAIRACPGGYGIYDGAGNRVCAETAQVRVTAQSGLNVRSGPGTDYGIKYAVPFGSVHALSETKNGWGRLTRGGGWLSLRWTAPA